VPDLVDADPVKFARTYLNSRPAVTEALGGLDRIGLRNKPPYPRLGIADTPGGSDLDMQWLTAPELSLTLWGDLDGNPPKDALWRILRIILQELRDMPNMPAVPGQPVVTHVQSTGAGGWSPEPTGQPRYTARVQLFMHPPTSIPETTP
jgi:hypothetical protein